MRLYVDGDKIITPNTVFGGLMYCSVMKARKRL